MKTDPLIPLHVIRAGAVLLRGAFLLLVFRPGLSGQCSTQVPACLAFLAPAKRRYDQR
jgi:hypothetical protein